MENKKQVDRKVVIWHLNLYHLLPPVLRRILNDDHCVVLVRVRRSQIIVGILELHVAIKILDLDSVACIQFLDQKF